MTMSERELSVPSTARDADEEPLLSIDDLDVTFRTKKGDVHAVNGVDLEAERGEIIGLVGESGSGKSVTCQSIVDLVPSPPAVISGEIRYKGRDLRAASSREMRETRGGEIGVVFQDPMSSLNPVHTVGRQICEAVRTRNRRNVEERAIELMADVGIPDPETRFSDFPFEFSGGMRQRIMIAIALANRPDLLIADEPTTALDVTIEAQVLEMIKDLRDENGMTVILITHDFGVVAEVADRVAVMYAGTIVERGDVFEIFDNPKHPYTRGLLSSVPGRTADSGQLDAIEGEPPDMTAPPTGCAFHPRCPDAMPHCSEEVPPPFRVEEASGTHTSRCYLYDDRPVATEDDRPSDEETTG